MALTLRNVKGSALTYAEMDANLTGLSDGTNWAATVNAGNSSLNINGLNAGNFGAQDLLTVQGQASPSGPLMTAQNSAFSAYRPLTINSLKLSLKISNTERAQITTDGYLKAGTGAYGTTNYHELTTANNGGFGALILTHSAATPGNQYGILLTLSGDPNDTSYAFQVVGNVTERATIRRNGGLANFSANNVNLSDARAKTKGAPAPSYWTFVEKLSSKLQRKSYADDPSRRLHTMLDAQDVEALDSELVSPWRASKLTQWKGISEHEIQMRVLGVVGELQRRVVKLEARA